MQEKLILWKPIRRYSRELHLKELLLEKGLKITFEDDDGKVIIFHYDRYHNETYILSYRVTEEYIRSADLHQKLTNAKEELDKPNGNWALFKVKNSNYVSWYDSLPGPGTDLNPQIEHHVYICSDYVIDVISTYEPSVTVVE